MRQMWRVLTTATVVVGMLLSTATAAEFTLRLGHLFTTGHPNQSDSERFAEEVAKRTNGRAEVKIFGSAVLGNSMQMAEMAQAGALDMTVAGGFLANFWPKFGIIDLPYIFTKDEDFQKVLWGSIGQQLADGLLKNANLRLLVWWPSGFRHVLTHSTPVNSLEDLKGLKLRVHENPLVVRTFRLLGANAVPMAYGEVYTSLKTGVIDAMENPLTSIANMRFGEVAKYLAYTRHFFLVEPLIMSEQVYQKLPRDIQKAIVDSAEATKSTAFPLLEKHTQEALVKIRQLGVKETHPELGPFKKAVAPIYEEYGKKLDAQDIIQRILTLTK